jgi:fibro-slime domain-containing protein
VDRVFIDGRLVMDLGGVAGGARQYVQVDRLGLTDGQRYPLHLFYAQRRDDVSVFRLRTNIELTSPVMVGGVSAGFD